MALSRTEQHRHMILAGARGDRLVRSARDDSDYLPAQQTISASRPETMSRRAPRSIPSVATLSALVVLCASCAREKKESITKDTRVSVGSDSVLAVPRWFSRADTLALQETQAHVIVSPIFATLQGEELVVVDPKERRIATFSTDGRLLWEHAQRGRGPGELELPLAAAKTSEGIWIADVFNGVFLLDPNSHAELRRLTNGSNALQGLIAINDTTLLVIGRGPVVSATATWLHAIDARTGRSRWNALEIAEESLPKGAARTFGYAAAHKLGDRLTVSFSLVDTVYQFDLNGGMLGKHHAPLINIRPLERRSREKPSVASLATLVRIVGAHEFGDSTIVVALQQGSGREPRYHMAFIDTRGRSKALLVRDTPMLVGATGHSLMAAFGIPDRPNVLISLGETTRGRVR
jgi:hypothetical protein